MQSCVPTLPTGPCPPSVAGPYAAWMPRKRLHGRTCGVSRDGGRARASQPSRRSSALQPMPLVRSALQTDANCHSGYASLKVGVHALLAALKPWPPA
ncbi:hypothetical protein XdyCFBP7245_01645 [Xanthomonas dyei]|uniref:Uncharacterized protein n=1 Tax=Xanthomonas dyei TaxID=743699 RepID=A0A2S7CC51_9XANT|nr:hypothetical protein XdyCFBP7245_01645 [Xanthomonas dyei]